MPILFQYRNIRHLLGMYITKQAEQEIYLIAQKKLRWCPPPPPKKNTNPPTLLYPQHFSPSSFWALHTQVEEASTPVSPSILFNAPKKFLWCPPPPPKKYTQLPKLWVPYTWCPFLSQWHDE